MKKINIQNKIFNKGITLLERNGETAKLRMEAEGAGLLLPELIDCQERYLSFYTEACEDHSVVFALRVYVKDNGKDPAFDVQFGILPGVRTPICIDLNWMNGHVLFPEAGVGQLKQVCHGRRVVQEEIEQIVLETLPVFHDFTLKITDIVLSEEYPSFVPLTGGKMVDELGQNKQKMCQKEKKRQKEK